MYLLKNVLMATFNTSFENTQNKQQYGTKITCAEERGKGYVDYKKMLQLSVVLTFCPHFRLSNYGAWQNPWAPLSVSRLVIGLTHFLKCQT